MKLVHAWLAGAFAVAVILAQGCAAKCGPGNCGGCCDATGACQAGSLSNACGTSGGACASCSGFSQCVLGVCSNPTGGCSNGCPSGTTCQNNTCVPNNNNDGGGCGPATCNGCCLPNQTCLQVGMETNNDCGTNGATCSDCAVTNATCNAGACTGGTACSAANPCASGCCNAATGFCVLAGSQTASTCGPNGQACQACSGATAVCQSNTGQCVATLACSVTTPCTSGCCDLATSTCITTANESNANCGLSGVCQMCSGTTPTCQPSTGQCVSNATGCSATNPCTTGCCDVALGLCLGAAGQTNSNCGLNGMICAGCPNPGDVCTVDASGNGTCTLPPPDGGPSGGVGNPCTTNAQCAAFLGAGGVCLQATADGGAGYPGGYCTLLNCTTGSCPASSQCVQTGALGFGGMPPFIDLYGETRTMCWMGCISDFDCNIPDYTCLLGNQINTTGTGFGTTPGLGCFINKPASAGETGKACNPTDMTVAGFDVCALPPTNGGCYAYTFSDGGTSTGACGSDCLGALADSVNGPDYWCGSGGVCLLTLADPVGNPLQASCEQKCNVPNGGPSNCQAAGDVCWGGITLGDGGAAPYGYCQPSCQQLGCNPPYTCVDAGTCLICDGGVCG